MEKLRQAERGDIPALKALWQLVFGDTDEFLDAFFELLFPDCRTAVMEEEGRIVAAAYAIGLENIQKLVRISEHQLPELFQRRDIGACRVTQLARHSFHTAVNFSSL